MYDITNRNTFTSVAGWMDSVSEHASPNITMILIGHKADLEDERNVGTQEGQKVGTYPRSQATPSWGWGLTIQSIIMQCLFHSWQSITNACSSKPAPKQEPTVARYCHKCGNPFPCFRPTMSHHYVFHDVAMFPVMEYGNHFLLVGIHSSSSGNQDITGKSMLRESQLVLACYENQLVLA